MNVTTKFAPGDIVYVICRNKVHEVRIRKIRIDAYADRTLDIVHEVIFMDKIDKIEPNSNEKYYNESNVYASKQELAAAIIG
jgi:hypothetical protein